MALDIPSPGRVAAERLSRLPGVIAIAMGGSRSDGWSDEASDVDLYVYARDKVPLDARRDLAGDSPRAEIDNRFWEPGDEWIDRATGLGVDVMYRSPEWIEGELNRVLQRHEPSLGYTTCLWHNVRAARPIYDPGGWLSQLREQANTPYPEELRRAIVAKNHPILRDTISSYRHQLELAARRGDPVSLNHRGAALLASYFDVLFAVNRVLHPGEKRLIARAQALCPLCPPDLETNVTRLLQTTVPGGGPAEITAAVNLLVDGLDAVLSVERLIHKRPIIGQL